MGPVIVVLFWRWVFSAPQPSQSSNSGHQEAFMLSCWNPKEPAQHPKVYIFNFNFSSFNRCFCSWGTNLSKWSYDLETLRFQWKKHVVSQEQFQRENLPWSLKTTLTSENITVQHQKHSMKQPWSLVSLLPQNVGSVLNWNLPFSWVITSWFSIWIHLGWTRRIILLRSWKVCCKNQGDQKSRDCVGFSLRNGIIEATWICWMIWCVLKTFLGMECKSCYITFRQVDYMYIYIYLCYMIS